MKVYVLETDVYEDREVHGVYETPEAAMAAWKPRLTGAVEPSTVVQSVRVYDAATGRTTDHPPARQRTGSYTWSKISDGYWEFDADFSDAATITEFEVGS